MKLGISESEVKLIGNRRVVFSCFKFNSLLMIGEERIRFCRIAEGFGDILDYASLIRKKLNYFRSSITVYLFFLFGTVQEFMSHVEMPCLDILRS